MCSKYKKKTKYDESNITFKLRSRIYEYLSKLNELMKETLSDLFAKDGLEIELDVDLFESDGMLIAEIVMPGINADDIKLHVESRSVLIRGEILASEDYDESEVFIMERIYGYAKRAFELPYPVNPSKTEAFYRDGILRVEMPIEEEEDLLGTDVKVKKF